MNEKPHPLIESLAKDLPLDSASHAAAVRMLEAHFDADAPAVAEAMRRLDAASGNRWKLVTWVAAGIAFAIMFSLQIPVARLAHVTQGMMDISSTTQNVRTSHLSPQEKLLIGDPSLSRVEQGRLLHESDPDNPAYFSEYAIASIYDLGELPDGFLETAARIDPENAYFLYLAAGVIGAEAIEKQYNNSSNVEPRVVDGVRLNPLLQESRFTITDEAVFEKAVAMIEQAAKLKRFESYTNAMIAERVRLFPGHDLVEFSQGILVAYGAPIGSIQVRKASDLMSARAEQLSHAGLAEDFLAFAELHDGFIASLANNPDIILVGELVFNVIATATAINFHAAAERLGLEALAETYRAQKDGFQDERDAKQIRPQEEYPDIFDKRASILVKLSLPMVQRQASSPPPLDESDLKPLRLVEHEVFGVIGLGLVMVILLGASLLVMLSRLVLSKSIQLPANRMAGLLRAEDFRWVVGLGVLLPVLVFFIISRYTPLGGRDYAVMYFLGTFPALHLMALLLALVIVPAWVVRWRLSRFLIPFGARDRFELITLGVLALLLMGAIFAYRALVYFGVSRLLLGALAVPALLGMVLLAVLAFRQLFASPITRFAQAATAAAVLPYYPLAMLMLCLLVPVYRAGEKHWIAKETLLRIDPDAPDLGAYEFKVAAQKRKEIRAILGME